MSLTTEAQIEAKRQAAIDRLCAQEEARIMAMPDTLPLPVFLSHRHCLNCGLPVTRYTPSGSTFDLGTSNEHRCPEEPGEVAECKCGETLLMFTSGKCLEWPASVPHECPWDDRLGETSLVGRKVVRRKLDPPQSPIQPRKPGVLEMDL